MTFLSPSRRAVLQSIGIDVWFKREANVLVSPTPGDRTDLASKDRQVWHKLQMQVEACVRCELHHHRTRTVFGVGNKKASWLVVGEAPGAEEDRQGKPFVGRAGQLLNAMLLAIGLSREEIYIANILKCRPPKNRDPNHEEVTNCEPYLERQIELLNPRIILAVGRVAAQNLLKSEKPIGRMRGRVYNYGKSSIPVVVTYHPAYLLRSPGDKRKAWKDLLLALHTLKNLGPIEQ